MYRKNQSEKCIKSVCRVGVLGIWGLNKSEIKKEEFSKVLTLQAPRLDRATLEMSPPLDRSPPNFLFVFSILRNSHKWLILGIGGT